MKKILMGLIAALVLFLVTGVSAEEYRFIGFWENPKYLTAPRGIEILDRGGDRDSFYVVNDRRIIVFNAEGEIEDIWPSEDERNFSRPNNGIAIDVNRANSYNSNIYLADDGNRRVLKLSLAGRVLSELKEWEVRGERDDFFSVKDVAVGPNGEVYVLDKNWSDSPGRFDRVVKFNARGEYLTQWGEREGIIFERPTALTVDRSGDVLVADIDKIRRFYASGKPRDCKEVVESGEVVDLDVDSYGNIYVVNWFGFFHEYKIRKLNQELQPITEFGVTDWRMIEASPGDALHYLDNPNAIAIRSNGDVYVTNSGDVLDRPYVAIYRPRSAGERETTTTTRPTHERIMHPGFTTTTMRTMRMVVPTTTTTTTRGLVTPTTIRTMPYRK